MRFFLEIQYDGTNYHGWQKQPNANSVQAVLESKLSQLFQCDILTMASGRTDTGVHCSQQFVHFDTDNLNMIPQLEFKLNKMLPSDISIPSIRRVKPETHTRFDATKRSYIYHIHQDKNPFLTRFSHQFFKKLDFTKMNRACEILKEYDDFEAFSKTNTDVKTTICQIHYAEWKQVAQGRSEFHISANRFLRGMVRLITGAMLDVGTGKISPEEFRNLIESKSRNRARHVVPACGLFLSKVEYPEGIFENELLP
jgi:tRNA pseudouridine38-40 synthase